MKAATLQNNRIFSELFSSRIRKQRHFEIIGPAMAEIELKKMGVELSGRKIEPVKAGRLLEVDAVIVTSFTATFEPWKGVNTVATASLIDMATGRIVATGTHREPTAIRKERKAMKPAAESLADYMLSLLHELAGGGGVRPQRERLPGHE